MKSFVPWPSLSSESESVGRPKKKQQQRKEKETTTTPHHTTPYPLFKHELSLKHIHALKDSGQKL